MKDSWRVGATLAATVVIAYSVCALVFVLLPAQANLFMTALFHGVDFSALKTTNVGLSGFFFVTCVLGGWAFVIGWLFAAISQLFKSPQL